jgi:hypothetical protein
MDAQVLFQFLLQHPLSGGGLIRFVEAELEVLGAA